MGNSSRKRRELEGYQRAAPVIQAQPAPPPASIAAPSYALPTPFPSSVAAPFQPFQSFHRGPIASPFPSLAFNAPINPSFCSVPFPLMQPSIPSFPPPVPQQASFISSPLPPQIYNQFPLVPQYQPIAPPPPPIQIPQLSSIAAPAPFSYQQARCQPQYNFNPQPTCAPAPVYAPPQAPPAYQCAQPQQQQLVLPPLPKGVRSSQCSGIVQSGPPPQLSLPEGFQLIGVQQLPTKVKTYQTENVQTCVQVDPCPRVREHYQLIPCNNPACLPRQPACVPCPPPQYCNNYRF